MYSPTKNFVRIIAVLTALFIAGIFAPAPTLQAQQSGKQFEARFWQFLMGNNYKNWAPAPGQNGDFYSGQAPHGALLKMYINRSAAGNVAGLKVGSVIVLENYRSDRSLRSISVMYRTEGFNPAANDWYWIEYKPDGTVAEQAASEDAGDEILASSSTKSTKLMGKAASCIACHRQATGSDFAFFNDKKTSNVAGGSKQTNSLR